jgi:cytidine deaminase
MLIYVGRIKIMDKTTLNNLLKSAYEIRANSYSPYSKFPVGCAVLLKDNSIIKGVNIENAAYGVVLCAERSAMASVISLGQQANIKAIAVATDASPPGSPCGMCRQFLSEFLSPTTPIIFGNAINQSEVTNISELLPYAFNKTNLE